MSVMNGFREELTQKILGFNAHISIKPYDTKITNNFYNGLKTNIEFEDNKINNLFKNFKY